MCAYRSADRKQEHAAARLLTREKFDESVAQNRKSPVCHDAIAEANRIKADRYPRHDQMRRILQLRHCKIIYRSPQHHIQQYHYARTGRNSQRMRISTPGIEFKGKREKRCALFEHRSSIVSIVTAHLGRLPDTEIRNHAKLPLRKLYSTLRTRTE
jgi:hypothetical protein